MLVYLISSQKVMRDNIKLKYFETGHTYLSADSKQKQMEKELKDIICKEYDLDDFQTYLSNAKCQDIEMDVSSFREWKSGMSQYSMKMLEKR